MEQNKKESKEVEFLTSAYKAIKDIYEKNPTPDNVKDWKNKVLPKLHGTNITKVNRLEIVSFPSNSYSFQMEKNEHEYEIARTVIVDTGIKLTLDNKTKENIEIKKLLTAREENIDFELQLAEMICGDNDKFPYRSSHFLTEFFQSIGYNFVHNGETRRIWVKERLEELDIKKIHALVSNGLFRKKYFTDFVKDKDINANDFFKAATLEFKEFIQNSVTANEKLDLSSILDMSVNVELLFDNEANTNDSNLNSLIEEAKERFFNPKDKQVALEKLWDAFERIKTYFSSEGLNKKQSAEKLVNLISENFDKEFIEEEFDKLTKIGNNYRIRHHETGKKELTPVHINYFFFKMLSLIDLCLTFLQQEEIEDQDLF